MEKQVSAEELRANDGREGRSAWVAYKGKVYDVSASKLWRNGQHLRRHNAGGDLTESFPAAPHDDTVFSRTGITLVGELVAPKPEAERRFPAWFEWILDRHPHPTSVHFPIAYVAAVAVFLVLYLLTHEISFELTGYYVLWGGVCMGAVAASMGVMSWWINWGHKSRWTFFAKMSLSAVLLFLGVVALVIRTSNPGALVNRDAGGWLYLVIVLLMVPTVAALGWIGDMIMYEKS